MCRNIRTLYNFDPPSTDEEIREASLQFVRKISGMKKPSGANEVEFDNAVHKVSFATREMLNSMIANGRPHNREIEVEKANARSAKRFGNI